MLLLLTACFLLGQGMDAREATESNLVGSYHRLENYKDDKGKYPPSAAGAHDLLGNRGVDGWGNRFVYVAADDGRGYEITSLGADGIEGGGGDDEDLGLSVSVEGEATPRNFNPEG